MRAEKHCKQWISQYLFIDCASSQGVAASLLSMLKTVGRPGPNGSRIFRGQCWPNHTKPAICWSNQWSTCSSEVRIWGPNFLAFSRLYRSRWNSSQGWSHTSRSLKISHWGHWLKGNSIEMGLIPACYNTSRSQRFRQFQSWSRRRHSPSKCIVVRPSFKRQLSISRISESLQYMIKQLS